MRRKTARRNGNSRAPGSPRKHQYFLRLYITGRTPRSANSLNNLHRICEQYLDGKYELEVIDIYQQPELAREAQIIATPTLVKRLPLPFRRLVGDLSDKQKVLIGLDIKSDLTGAETDAEGTNLQ